MSWDNKKIEILKNEWGKGKTASQIAELIGGVSRNAVIGKAHRLNLSSKIKTKSGLFNNLANKNQKTIAPMVHKESVNIDLSGKKLKYFECNNDIPLQIEAFGPKTLRIISRLEFTEKMGSQESYRIHVKSGIKVIGTYFFNTERSGSSKIQGKSDKVPGKWRSCELKVPIGKNNFSIEVFDEGKTVLTRFMLY